MRRGKYLVYLLTLFSTLFPLEKPVIYEAEPRNPVVIEERQDISLSLVGDILMDGSVRGQIEKNGVDYPWEYVKTYFQNDDLTIGNLETSITSGGTIWPDKQFNFRSDPKNLKAMREAGIEVVSLANNHSLDYGYSGFLDTLDHLDKNHIKRVGGGKNRKEALEGVIIEKQGLKIGILGFSRVVPSVDWYATDKRPGLVGAYDPHVKDVLERVRKIKEEVDILVLSIHWGIELSEFPRKEEITLGRQLIDEGVDVVMGHHPHVVQGIEIYKGKPIIYSLGNFIFGSKNELTANTMIAQVNFQGKDINDIEIIPCEIVLGRPIPLEGEKRLDKIKYLNSISKPWGTSITNSGLIELK